MHTAFAAFSIMVYELMQKFGVVYIENCRKVGKFSETNSLFTFFIARCNPYCWSSLTRNKLCNTSALAKHLYIP